MNWPAPRASGSRSSWTAWRPDVEFVFLVLHHPPYTSSSDDQKFGRRAFDPGSGKGAGPHAGGAAGGTRARFMVLSSHVHNYERHEHGGVAYFVTGGGGAHAYPIERAPEDLFQSRRVNYHYLQIHVEKGEATITMRRLGLETPTPLWTSEDKVRIAAVVKP